MIKVIDNLLTPRYHQQLLQDATGVIQYSYVSKTVQKVDSTDLIYQDENTYDCGQLSSLIVAPQCRTQYEWYFNFIKPLIYSVEDAVSELYFEGVNRIKFNLLLSNKEFPENHYNIPHQDEINEHYSLIYYLNDSDGDTYLFNEFYEDGKLPDKLTIAKRITPKKNRAVIFESNRYHASSNPKVHNERFVINFVFKASER